MSNTTTISKWGNAQGVRIPKAYCKQIGVDVGDSVVIRLTDNAIVIEPSREDHTIQGRMRAWDGKRLESPEFDWGEPTGKELW